MRLVDFELVCVTRLQPSELRFAELHPYAARTKAHETRDARDEKFDLKHIVEYVGRVKRPSGVEQSVFDKYVRDEYREYEDGVLCLLLRRFIEAQYGGEWCMDVYYPLSEGMLRVFEALGGFTKCGDNSVMCVRMKDVRKIGFVTED